MRSSGLYQIIDLLHKTISTWTGKQLTVNAIDDTGYIVLRHFNFRTKFNIVYGHFLFTWMPSALCMRSLNKVHTIDDQCEDALVFYARKCFADWCCEVYTQIYWANLTLVLIDQIYPILYITLKSNQLYWPEFAMRSYLLLSWSRNSPVFMDPNVYSRVHRARRIQATPLMISLQDPF